MDQLEAKTFAARKGRSGSMGFTLDLDKLGHKYIRKAAAASMKRQGLVAKTPKKYKDTTGSDLNLPVPPNHLRQDFSAQAPNHKWVRDIFSLRTGEGCL